MLTTTTWFFFFSLGSPAKKQKWSEYWNRSILRVLVFRFMRRPGRGGWVGEWSVERLAKH
jgi:hypothetical protein